MSVRRDDGIVRVGAHRQIRGHHGTEGAPGTDHLLHERIPAGDTRNAALRDDDISGTRNPHHPTGALRQGTCCGDRRIGGVRRIHAAAAGGVLVEVRKRDDFRGVAPDGARLLRDDGALEPRALRQTAAGHRVQNPRGAGRCCAGDGRPHPCVLLVGRCARVDEDTGGHRRELCGLGGRVAHRGRRPDGEKNVGGDVHDHGVGEALDERLLLTNRGHDFWIGMCIHADKSLR